MLTPLEESVFGEGWGYFSSSGIFVGADYPYRFLLNCSKDAPRGRDLLDCGCVLE